MDDRKRRGFSRGHVVIILALLGGGLVLAAQLVPRLVGPRKSELNIAAQARDYLRDRNVKRLDIPLDQLLSDPAVATVPTLRHPLLDKAAPDFRLSDPAGHEHSLAEQLKRGPVVVVFYYGYYCNHCVSQLFALDDDIAKFHELGAEVLAISADSPQETAEKFAKFGMFSFPVLSDLGNQTAAAYSVFAPPSSTAPEVLLHGTFVIDREGVVCWCQYGHEPFTDNAALLVETDKAAGRLEQKRVENPSP